MSKQLIVSQASWAKIYNQIAKEYPPSVLLIRTKMKSVLGFTSRTHTDWVFDSYYLKNVPKVTIHLDFYNESKKTMFLLKFSEFLEKPTLDHLAN